MTGREVNVGDNGKERKISGNDDKKGKVDNYDKRKKIR